MSRSYRNLLFFMLAFCIMLYLGMLTACQTTSTGTSAISVSQMLTDAATLNNALVTTSATLVNAGTISSADGATILKVTDDINAAIAAANQIYATGNSASAQAKIAAVIDLLATAATCINSAKAAGASITSCIAPVLATAGGL